MSHNRSLSSLLTNQHSANYWTGTRTKKYAQNGVTRGVPPENTVRRVRALMPRIGVTRIGEVTYLDRNGVPGFIAVRPGDIGPGITYYNGKGTTRSQARASAMMEALERYSGERCHLPVAIHTVSGAKSLGPIVDPNLLTTPRTRQLNVSSLIEWVAGFNLISWSPTLVPLNAVVCPYETRGFQAHWFCSTNGLASGNTLSEALSHALCEINERDAMALASTNTGLAFAIRAIAGDRKTHTLQDGNEYSHLEHEGLPPRAARILAKLKRAGLKVYLRDITSDTKIPTIDCTVVEERWDGFVAHAGFGSHPDLRVALLRAMTEAAQSRVACIQGGREDLPEFVTNKASPEDPDSIFGIGPWRRFSQSPSFVFKHVEDDIEFMLRQFNAAGLKTVVAIDLTDPVLQIPVVRVVVPTAETWSVFHLHTKRGRIGPRADKLLRGLR